MSQHCRLMVRGYPIDLYDFVGIDNFERYARSLEGKFARMPNRHLEVVYPIFAVEAKPRGGTSGGTLSTAGARRMLGARLRTGVPDDKVRSILLEDGQGVCMIPRNRWERRSIGDFAYTVLHEVGHCVHYTLGLLTPAMREEHFAGVRPICGAMPPIAKFVTEAYARFILSPQRICRDPVQGESAGEANARVISHLRTTPAFSHLPRNWMPGSGG